MIAGASARRFASVLVALLAVGASTGCSSLFDAPQSAPTPLESSVDAFQPVYDAIATSDPRVERASTVTTSLSGAARQLTVVIRITGSEPVSTQTLSAVLIAVRDSAHGDADMLDLVARDASNPKQILDLSDAIRGLPSGLSTVWIDGGLVVPMSDLAALG